MVHLTARTIDPAGTLHRRRLGQAAGTSKEGARPPGACLYRTSSSGVAGRTCQIPPPRRDCVVAATDVPRCGDSEPVRCGRLVWGDLIGPLGRGPELVAWW